MIGGGGSTAKRTAADVMGDCDAAPAEAELAGEGAGAGAEAGEGLGDEVGKGAENGAGAEALAARTGACDESTAVVCACGRASTGLPMGATGAGRGTGGRATDMTDGSDAAGVTATVFGVVLNTSPPRKSLTRVSTSWLIEMWLVSQNAFSRSYVVRLTLMLRRVCFLAMIYPYATGRVPSSRTY